MNDHDSLALDRVRASLGSDLLRTLSYPGGPRQLYRDLLNTENRVDLLLERAALATAVLKGEADDFVRAWDRRCLEEDVFCDHCHDLPARFVRAARDHVQREHDRDRAFIGRVLATIRRMGLGSRFETHDRDEALEGLAAFFGIKPSETMGDPHL